MSRIIKVLTLCSLLSVFSAFSLTVDEAKEKGVLGETLSGYLAVVKTENVEAVKLAEQINREREKKYSEIASKNNLKTNEVARIAGQKLVERANAGEYVRGINGQWLKKK
ncbi:MULTISPECIES: YdbL family protein [Providencia]|uniref:YdbL family protein n=1 Tax=Providencia TaxID=586 RepID=UPI0019810D7A|nr:MULTISPECIES: YdbL family protein [Providencia]HEC8327319.1 YdbL family protein [Providencia rettgeri]MBN4865040.1 YdbL family protein [Providencia stuartii]MBN4874735.1 YdbL family protein [Providencia stuartii]MBN4879052.1 YdbL family protein [Providencia stuartii]MBN4883935.1 YdbL family protein [Providencia stuartii]